VEESKARQSDGVVRGLSQEDSDTLPNVEPEGPGYEIQR